MNLYDDADFVFNFPYDFKNRFNGEPDYFSAHGEQVGFLLHTNFIPDAVNLPLIEAKERGAGGGHIRFNMAKGSIPSHISQFAVGTYKKGHAHGAGAHVIVLSGEGYSLMWPEGEEPKRYEWQVGTLIVPPNRWFHQHFNAGPHRRAIWPSSIFPRAMRKGVPLSWISRRLGGNQIDYADEDPNQRAWHAQPVIVIDQLCTLRELLNAECAAVSGIVLMEASDFGDQHLPALAANIALGTSAGNLRRGYRLHEH